MKVLFYQRADHATKKGGDLVQMHQTAKALEQLGVNIEYSSDPKKNLSDFDIVHCFNSPNFLETKAFFDNAKKQGKLVVFSTIFWSKEELAIGIADSTKVKIARKIFGVPISKKIWRILKSNNYSKPGTKENVEKQLFAAADMLLPNSESELRQIENTYHLSGLKYKSITNAIDTELFKKPPSHKRDDYILSVGRIENRKNTQKLIEACHNLNLKLVLIGGYGEDDTYANKCLEMINKYKVEHIQYLEPEQLLPYYYGARVHAMVSWYETPGLASMEAACGGCTIVTTDRGSTLEYFGKQAIYCDPFSISSIQNALKLATEEPFDLALRDKIFKNYTWDHAAKQTLFAYEELS